MSILEQLKRNKLVAVIRHANEENILGICRALSEGGIKAVEITAETPKVTALIEKAVNECDDDMLIGAGTVLDPETARNVMMAGAKFVVSPTLNKDTISMTKRYGIVSIPGALTPTEILTAYEYGADMVKVFPVNGFGPGYIKNIHGPMPQIPLMVTGGINLTNIAEYHQHGAKAIGIGGNLVNPSKLKKQEDYQLITQKSQQYVEKIALANDFLT